MTDTTRKGTRPNSSFLSLLFLLFLVLLFPSYITKKEKKRFLSTHIHIQLYYWQSIPSIFTPTPTSPRRALCFTLLPSILHIYRLFTIAKVSVSRPLCSFFTSLRTHFFLAAVTRSKKELFAHPSILFLIVCPLLPLHTPYTLPTHSLHTHTHTHANALHSTHSLSLFLSQL